MKNTITVLRRLLTQISAYAFEKSQPLCLTNKLKILTIETQSHGGKAQQEQHHKKPKAPTKIYHLEKKKKIHLSHLIL
jgi:hypothetical protein